MSLLWETSVLRMQDAPSFSRLLQMGPDGEPEFITLQELKPHHPTNSPCSYFELSSVPENTCPPSMFHGGGHGPAPGHVMPTSNVVPMERHQPVDGNREELVPRKRRNSGYTDLDEDTGDETKSVRTTEDNKKQNHSEIEKRRRDKMNTYITELSSMVPMCHAMSRKLDKLTVLRMAVQHLKTIRGAVHSYTEGYYKPPFLSDQELKTLILQAAEGFLFVVDSDRGRILFVSESVSQILNFAQSDLLGQNWFDILHPKDVAKVKEQLSSSDVSPRERLIDAKTMLPVKTDAPPGLSHLSPGARRSFFCRMKCRQLSQVKEEADTTTGCQRRKKQHQPDRKYCVVHCTGYLKSWAPTKVGLEVPEGEEDSCNLSCLVAVGRVMPQLPSLHASSTTHHSPPNTRTIQFVSRHAMDGKFIFVDQRATIVLGFLPQELLGTSMYEYYHQDDVAHLADAHKTALQSPTNERVTTQVYKFKSKDESFVKLQSEWKSFRNPWTKEVEYLVAKNCVILSEPDLRVVESSAAAQSDTSQSQTNYEYFSPPCDRSDGMEQAISLHMEASKIGRQIADAMLDSHKQCRDVTPDGTSDTQHNQVEETLPPNEVPDSGTFGPATNPPLSVTTAPEDVIEMIGDPLLTESPIQEPDDDANDGNDEAAMAVIMSLLEADAGLGGPVDFSGLPWPLP